MTQQPIIAIAEDEPDLRDALEDWFGGNGFTVIAAGDAAGLRAAVAGRRVDVALLDIVMPGEDGLTLARWFRAQGPVGLILATALGRPVDRINGLDLGADDYVVKPYDLRELLARVRSVLRRQPGVKVGDDRASDRQTTLGPLVIDSERRTISLPDGDCVTLSEAEFRVLAILFERRGRIVARDALAAACGVTGDLRAVDVRVARLRKKMALLPGGDGLLTTLRGEGYRLRDD